MFAEAFGWKANTRVSKHISGDIITKNATMAKATAAAAAVEAAKAENMVITLCRT